MKKMAIEYHERNMKIASLEKEEEAADKKRKYEKQRCSQRLKNQQLKPEEEFDPLSFKLTEYELQLSDDGVKVWMFKEGKRTKSKNSSQ